MLRPHLAEVGDGRGRAGMGPGLAVRTAPGSCATTPVTWVTNMINR